MAGICVSAIAVLKLYHGTEFNWINDEFLSRVDRVEKWGGGIFLMQSSRDADRLKQLLNDGNIVPFWVVKRT